MQQSFYWYIPKLFALVSLKQGIANSNAYKLSEKQKKKKKNQHKYRE